MQALSIEGLRNSLEILYPVKLVMTGNSNRIQINLIEIDKKVRGKGFGREVMETIIAYSELHHRPIELTPSGAYGSSVRKLKKFYKKLGFVKNKRRRAINHYDLIRNCSNYVY